MTYNSPTRQASWPRSAHGGTAVEVDTGLRQYMLRAYNFMAGGLAVTGVAAAAAVAMGSDRLGEVGDGMVHVALGYVRATASVEMTAHHLKCYPCRRNKP